MTSTPESDAPAESVEETVVVTEVVAEETVLIAESGDEETTVVVDEVAVGEVVVEVEPVAPVPDEALLNAHDLAVAALREITPAASIGAPAGYSVEPDGVVSLRFETLLAGYPGWHWTVSLARVADAEPTVLEVELLPGEHALLAPEWVPWAVRLAEYRAQQAAAAALAESEGGDDDSETGDEDSDDETDELDDDGDDLEDADDLDEADFDTDGSSILHAGDVDGVDIDELDDDADEDEDDSDEDADDDSDEDDSDDEDTDDPEDDDRR